MPFYLFVLPEKKTPKSTWVLIKKLYLNEGIEALFAGRANVFCIISVLIRLLFKTVANFKQQHRLADL